MAILNAYTDEDKAIVNKLNEIVPSSTSTTLISGGSLVVASLTEITIGPGIGKIVTGEIDAPVITDVSWLIHSNFEIVDRGNRAMSLVTIDINGDPEIFDLQYTPSIIRNNIILGVVYHTQGQIEATFDASVKNHNSYSQFLDTLVCLGVTRCSKLGIYANANLTLKRSSGKLMSIGVGNAFGNISQNIVDISSQNPVIFRRILNATGTLIVENSATTFIDPVYYDTGTGSKVLLPLVTDATNIYIFQEANEASQTVNVAYGQTLYSSLNEAAQGISTEQIIVPDTISSYSNLIAIISARRDAMDLTNPDQAKITPGPKFGIDITGGAIINNGGDVNVQSDWDQTDTGADDYIKNKPGVGTGDVVGPASSIDNGVAIYNSTTGKIIKTTTATITPTGDLSCDNVIVTGNVDGRDVSVDGAKLDGIDTGAQVNNISDVNATDLTDSGDSTLHYHASDRDRANHTGTQAASTISDFDTQLAGTNNTIPFNPTADYHVATRKFVIDNTTAALNYKGGYDAANNIPDLDVSPSGVMLGDFYTITSNGTFFTATVNIGDAIISEKDNATLESDWTILNRNLDAATIKMMYESNPDTNAFTDAAETTVSNQSGINTGDEIQFAGTTTTPGQNDGNVPDDGSLPSGRFLKDDGTWAAVGGGGDMLGANNLSDVVNAVTSLSNIGGEPAFSKNTAFNKDFGTSSGTALEGDTTTISAQQALDITANNAKISADGSVTTHNDVTDAGSGAIITTVERSNLGNQSGTNTGDVTLASDDTTQETLDITGQELSVDLVSQTTDGAMAADDKLKLDNLSDNGSGDDWVSGLQITEQSPKDQTVNYSLGTYLINAILKTVTPGGNYDLISYYSGFTSYQHALVGIYVDTDEIIKSVAGITAEKDEVADLPVIPTNSVCLAIVEIKVDSGANPKDIGTKEIEDCRLLGHFGSDQFVAVSADDIGVGYLSDKQTNNGNVTYTIENPGGVETLRADVDIAADSAVAANTSKVTNATHTGEVTGSDALALDSTAISNKTSVVSLAGTEEVIVNETGTLKKTTTQDIADLGGGGSKLAVQAYQFTDVTGISSDTDVVWDDNEIDPDNAYNASTGILTIPQSWIDDYDYMEIRMSVCAGYTVVDTKLTQLTMYFNDGSDTLYMRDGHGKLKSTEAMYNLLSLTTAKLSLSDYTAGDYFYGVWENGAPYANMLGGHDNFIQVELF